MNLKNRTVLITGGSSGIGLGLAEAFLNNDSRVIVCGRNEEKLNRLRSKHPEITAWNCDVGDSQQRRQLAEKVLKEVPKLDLLVNNAGIQRYIDLKKGYTELKAGEDEIAINFSAVVELTALLIDHLLHMPFAAVINVSSGLGFMPMRNTPVYSATKAAVHTYSLVLRQQLKGSSVQVFEIVPPMVDTDLNQVGRAAAARQYRGISIDEYIPGVLRGLENDQAIIFHGDGDKVLNEPRAKSENSLLNPAW